MTRSLLLLLVLFGLNAGETGLPKPGTLDGVGVNIHFTHAKAGELEMLAAGGFRFVRMDFFWENIEREKGIYDFAAYDHLMADLDRNGLRAYFILDYGHRLYDGGRSPHTDEGRAAFCAFVKATMQRFAGRGIVWEMWNEPNHGMFWKPVPKVDDYIALAQAVGETVREVAPKEILVGPTTSEIDVPFLEACFKAGLLGVWDAVSVHPYRQSPPESVTEEYRTLRTLIRRHRLRFGGDQRPDPPILSGEWGYTSAKLPHGGFDEQQQASYLSRQWLSNIANGVPISIWYDWHDDGDDRSNPEHNFGTVRRPYRAGQAEVYEPKPAYVAAKMLTTVLKGYEFSKALALKDDEHVLLFAKGDQLRLAAWTSAKETRTVAIPASAGRFRVSGHLGKELPEVVADENGLTLTLTGDVQYLAPIDANPSLRLAVAWERLPHDIVVTLPPSDSKMALDRSALIGSVDALTMTVAVQTRLTNPLERPVHIANGQVPTPYQGVAIVPVVLPAGERSPMPRGVAASLEIDGRLVWTQPSKMVCTNPLSLNLLTPFVRDGAQLVPVHIDNTHGSDVFGELILTDVEDALLSRPQHLHILAGRQQIMVVPLKTPPADHVRLGARITAPLSSHPLRTLPAITLTPLFREDRRWSVHADGDAKVGSTQTLGNGKAEVALGLDEAATLDLDYRCERGWKFLRVAPKDPIDIGAAREIGMWIHGDGSGNVIRMRVVDASGQVFQPDGGKLTHVGWKWTTFTLTPHTARWGGANDGVVKPPLKLDTLLLLDQADQSKPSQGTVRIAGAMVVE